MKDLAGDQRTTKYGNSSRSIFHFNLADLACEQAEGPPVPRLHDLPRPSRREVPLIWLAI